MLPVTAKILNEKYLTIQNTGQDWAYYSMVFTLSTLHQTGLTAASQWSSHSQRCTRLGLLRPVNGLHTLNTGQDWAIILAGLLLNIILGFVLLTNRKFIKKTFEKSWQFILFIYLYNLLICLLYSFVF